MDIQFRKANRKAVPLLISVSSVSGGGKTYSSLLLAAGLAGQKGRVGFIDTENGRGEMYVDSPGIMKALPGGFEYTRMDPDFSPERYVEYLTAAERAGITVCVVDSATHEWEGIGGCCEIAEKNPLGRMPNWAKAKIAHKRFVNYCLSSSMHIIFCLRAREKVKVFKKGDSIITGVPMPGEEYPIAEKDCIVSLGVSAITEKNLVFEMLLSLYLDEHTHYAIPTKVPEPLQALFTGKRLLTKEDGERIREWNESGSASDVNEQLIKRSRAAAADGVEKYRDFFGSLTPAQRKALAAVHDENKRIAAEADHIPVFGSPESPAAWPDDFDGPELIWNGQRLRRNEESGNYTPVSTASAA
jgi:hypothetical protein